MSARNDEVWVRTSPCDNPRHDELGEDCVSCQHGVVEWYQCVMCEGRGEVWTQDIYGYDDGGLCTKCDGTGEVAP